MEALELWHDNTGDAPGWQVKEVCVKVVIDRSLYDQACVDINRWLVKSRPGYGVPGATTRILVEGIHNGDMSITYLPDCTQSEGC